MANVKATWSLPTVSRDQRPIAKVTVELSADAGAHYSSLPDVLVAAAQETALSDVDPGAGYQFRLTVVDVDGNKGNPLVKPFVIAALGPGQVQNVVVTIT